MMSSEYISFLSTASEWAPQFPSILLANEFALVWWFLVYLFYNAPPVMAF